MRKLGFSLLSMRKLLLMRYLLSLLFCIHSCSSTDPDTPRFDRQSGKGSSALQQITDDFSILARVVNGIALQEGLTDGSADPDIVLAELLNIESGDTVHNLLETRIDKQGLSEKLETTLSEINKLGVNPLTDSSKVREGIIALESMKNDVDDLKSGTKSDGLQEFINEAKELKDAMLYEAQMPFSEFQKIAEYLKILRDDSFEQSNIVAPVRINDLFTTVSTSKRALINIFKDLAGYEQIYRELLNIKDKYKILNPISAISKAGQDYNRSWEVFESLSEKMKTLKKDTDILIPFSKSHESYAEAKSSLKQVADLVKALFSLRKTEKVFAEGFPGGASDMLRIKADLKEKWLKEKIADGSDTSYLIPQFISLENIGNSLMKVSEEWNGFKKTGNIVDIITDLLSSFEVLVNDGKLIKDVNNLEESLNTLTSATSSLKKIKGDPPFADFDYLFTYCETIGKNSVKFGKAFEKMFKNGDQRFLTASSNFLEIDADVLKNEVSVENAKIIANKARAISGFDHFVEVVVIASEELGELLSGELNSFMKTKPNWAVIEKVQKSLEGTGLETALTNLNGQSVDLNNIDKILKFGIKVREIKKESIESVSSILEQVEKLKEEMKKVKIVMTRSRHKRDVEKKLKKLKDSKSLALDLGRGVNLLQKFVDVYEKRSLVQTVADFPTEVFREIRKLLPMSSIWTKDTTKAMTELTPEVEKLEKYAQENKDAKDLIQIGSVFSKASEIRGAPVDTTLFDDQFLQELKKSQSPIVQGSASSFLELSRLELDFSKHSTSIKAASLALTPLREYFDEVFGITRTPSGEVKEKIVNNEVTTGISMEILFYIIGIVVFVLLIIGGVIYFICKCRRDHKYYQRLRDSETWVLLSFTEENKPVEFGNGFAIKAYEYIIRNNYGAFRTSLKKGAYVDAKVQSHKQSNTMLHEAVLQGRPKFVEALIKHGATREILNHEYETPYQMAVRMKKKSCIAVFKKYAKRTFKVVPPEPLAKHDYMIKVEKGIPEEEHYHADFFKKFGQYQTEGLKRPTHYVVKTDKKGVLHVEEHHLPHIFSASMIMSHRWLKSCLDNSSKISNNHEYRVTKMKFKGKEYNNLLEIKDFINRMNVPYMFGIGVSYNNNTTNDEWGVLKRLTGQLGVYVGTGDFPFVSECKKGTTYHRDDLPRNFLIYRSRDRTQVELNFKSKCIDNPDFWFISSDEFIHYLLSFKIKSKSIAKIDAKNHKVVKSDENKNKKGDQESECSNSAPENSDVETSDAGASTMGGTPISRTPESRTPGSRTPGSRTPGSRTPASRTPISRTPGKKRRH